MPIYTYESVETGERFDFTQKMDEPRYTSHPDSGEEMIRVIVAGFSIRYNGIREHVKASAPRGTCEFGTNFTAPFRTIPDHSFSSLINHFCFKCSGNFFIMSACDLGACSSIWYTILESLSFHKSSACTYCSKSSSRSNSGRHRTVYKLVCSLCPQRQGGLDRQ